MMTRLGGHFAMTRSAMTGGAALRDTAAGWLSAAAFVSMALAAARMAGCTKREKVLDVETPAGNIEVYEEKPVTE